MSSPYIGSNVGSNWGTPSNLAAMLYERDRELQQSAGQIGKLAGAVGAGAVGAFQGAANPGVFGGGTSTGSGAMQGFAQNYASDWQGGQGGGGSGISGLMARGGDEGGSGGGGTPNFKQLQHAGKAADSMWKAAAEGMLTKGSEDVRAFGKTKEEWDTLGSQDKFAVIAGAIKGQQQKAVMQAYDAGQQHFAQAAQEMMARQQDMEAQRQRMEAEKSFAKGASLTAEPTAESVFHSALANPTAPSSAPWLKQAAELYGELRRPVDNEIHRLNAETAVKNAETARINAERLNRDKSGKVYDNPEKKPTSTPEDGWKWIWNGVRWIQQQKSIGMGFGEIMGALAAPQGKESAAKPAAAPDKKAQGGYKIGSVYGGLRYLGGDPNDRASFEKAY